MTYTIAVDIDKIGLIRWTQTFKASTTLAAQERAVELVRRSFTKYECAHLFHGDAVDADHYITTWSAT